MNGASRIWSLVALALFLALPLILIGNYAADRAGSQAIVAEQIGAAWGGPQTLTGPYLVVPVSSRGEALAEPLVLLPDLLDIDSELTTEVRSRGVFETPVYRGRHDIRLGFDPARLSGERANELLAEGETPLWDQAVLGLGIAEPRALKGALELNRPDGRASFESGSGIEGLPGIHARVGDARDASQGWLFTLELDGSRRFLLTPAGRVTRGRLHSDWPHGGFAGSFLPSVSQAGVTGFVAEWSVPQLAHSLPQAFRGTAPLAALGEAAFGVDLLPPTDLYDGARQAAKFGFAVIVLSFAMIYLMERSAARRPHLVQYGLIGTVQCLFFVLLLSLAEQIGLGPAYALAAAATIALLTLYSWFGLGLGQRSVWLCAALIVTYGGIYLVLTQGQTLLMAALLAFVAVAAAMWGTRNGDWSTALPRDWRAAWNGNGPQPGPQASSNS